MSEGPRQLPVADVLDPDRFMDYEANFEVSSTMPLVLELLDRPGMSLLDVGGATGVYVHEIARRARHPIEGRVLEVDERYASRGMAPGVELIQASILDSGLPDGSFDVITFRHVLHHLVGPSAAATLELQRRALSEMLRITKPGGHLVFEEQVHLVKPFSRIVFALSAFASRHRLRWRFFETGTVVVSFMTPAEVDEAVAQACARHGASVVHRSVVRRKVPLRWRLTLLMAHGGDVTVVVRKAT